MQTWGKFAILLCLGAGVAIAEPKPEVVVKECTSCTARHKSLQALQEARVPPLAETATRIQEDEGIEVETANE